ncbi:hypothetical protein F4818DRAFT_438807 [Hypoxylon cercidicola]|nr:hypothetical protein F4818DRAFT_438807 [Hypoxylon cercidicola]
MSTTGANTLESTTGDRGPAFRAYILVLTVLALVATAFRFWSRYLSIPQQRHIHRFWWDDWVALAAAATLVAQLGLTLTLVDAGLGHHASDLSLQQLTRVLKFLYIEYFIFDSTLFLTKISALMFLVRVFPNHERKANWFSISIWTIHGCNIAWFVGKIFGLLFVCDRISKNWMPWIDGKCGTTNSLYLGSAVPSAAMDLAILIVPLPKIWQLHTSSARKVGITITFALGYSVIIVSLGRLITVLLNTEALNNDITYKGVDVFYWTWMEPPITIISICLPAMLRLGYHLNSTYLQPLISKASFVFTGSNLRIRTANSSTSDHQNHRNWPKSKGSGSFPDTLNNDSRAHSSGNSETEVLHSPQHQHNFSAYVHSDGEPNSSTNTLSAGIRIHRDVHVCGEKQ